VSEVRPEAITSSNKTRFAERYRQALTAGVNGGASRQSPPLLHASATCGLGTRGGFPRQKTLIDALTTLTTNVGILKHLRHPRLWQQVRTW
jgi:hypothetical protein